MFLIGIIQQRRVTQLAPAFDLSPPVTPTIAADRARYWSILACGTLFFLLFSLNAHAATDGDTLWGQLKGMWFGAPGLVIGAVMLTIGVIGFFRNGFGWSAVVAGITAVFFLVPGLAIGFQKYAATIAN